ncbi:MAG: G5 domain-containing protein [Clostridia bacterium]|nr:G5 domain-containing protein [Clostridia bacterium]
MKKIVAGVWKGMRSAVAGRVFAAVLMCVVTLSVMMGVSSQTRVYTMQDGDVTRVVVTLSDTPYLTFDGRDTVWVDTTVSEPEEEAEDTGLSVEVFADGQSTLVYLPEEGATVSEVIDQAGVTVGELDQVNADKDATATDGMLVQVDRVEYEEYTVTETVHFKTTYRQTCVLKPGKTKVDIYGKNGEKQITYRKSYVNGELVKEEKVGEVTTKKARNQVVLKGSAYGTPIAKTPSNANIKLDSKNQPVNYSRVIYGSCTAYHGDSATSTGRKPGVGVVAVDPREIPYGSILWIVSKDGSFVYGYAIAGDTGGFIHNSETVVDLYMDSVVEMNTFGRRNLNVYVIKEGNGR